jgi:hypothetical protein
MIFPNISALKKLVNNFFPGAPNTTQDFLQLIRASDGTILGWIDEAGILRGSLAPSPVVAPCYINLPTANGTNTTGVETPVSGFLFAGSGQLAGPTFYLPTQLTSKQITFTVITGDATNEYDIGIYGPYTGVETTVPLQCHLGAQKFSANTSSPQTFEWISPVTLQPGYYFLWITTASSSGIDLVLLGQNNYNTIGLYFWAFSETLSTNSVLPSSAAVTGAEVNATTPGLTTQNAVQIQFGLS